MKFFEIVGTIQPHVFRVLWVGGLLFPLLGGLAWWTTKEDRMSSIQVLLWVCVGTFMFWLGLYIAIAVVFDDRLILVPVVMLMAICSWTAGWGFGKILGYI